MIKETLKAMSSSHSLTEMAKKLGVGQEDVRQRLNLLEEKGLVQKTNDFAEGCPPAACVGCHCSSCPPPQGAAAYVITNKGKKALGRA